MNVDLPIVALVGRPNVGKSSLYNRMVGRRQAIVEDLPGTTRDRSYETVNWGGRDFLLVDTAGLSTRGLDELAEAAEEQARFALAEADLLLLVTDVLGGVTDRDEAVAGVIRRGDKPFLLLVNKCDTAARAQEAPDYFRLGLGEPHPVSAQHGHGVADALDRIVQLLPDSDAVADEDDRRPRLAIVGRPNVGKSSLLNLLAGENRALVSEIAGTTRDAVDTTITHEGREILLVDTAGLRRRGRVLPGVERYSVLRALSSVRRADVCLLMLDATDGATDQDAHIAGYVTENYRGLVVLANKWDLVEDDEYAIRKAEESMKFRLAFTGHAPILRISALTGMATAGIIPTALKVDAGNRFTITTGKLNQFLNGWVGRRPPPSRGGRPAHFRYATQTGTRPPAFTLFFSDPRRIRDNYVRYLENGLREEFGLQGTAVKMVLRGTRGE